jgi:pyruvate,orthophosphate dikinase
MFAQTVMGVDEGLLERARAEMRVERNAGSDLGLDVADLKELVAVYLDIVAQEAGCAFVRSPRAQLEAIIAALFRSRDGERAPIGRQQGRTPDGPGTAITVDMMVFGNLGLGSGTGVAFSRDPATGNRAVCGRYLQDAQREDLAAGARHTVPLGELEHLDERVYGQLLRIMSALEYHYGQPCQIGFTIERGRLWVLQATIGKRAAPGPTVTGRATTAQGLGRLGAESFRVLAQPGTRR